MKYLLLLILLFSGIALRAQQQFVYQSKNLPKPDTVWVFTPEDMQGDRQLPMLFLLHGYSGTYKQWDSIMDAQRYADEYGFIIVCPDGLKNSWYVNSPAATNARYENFFFDELWPDMMQKFKPAADQIFISGLSMGGHGALTLFLKKPELFKSAGSTSGVTDLSSLTSKYELSQIIGAAPEEKDTWLKYSAMGNIERLKGTNKAFIFDCGASDPFYEMNNAFKKKCDELKLNATYISQPGGHNRAYWAVAIRQHFNFFKAQLK